MTFHMFRVFKRFGRLYPFCWLRIEVVEPLLCTMRRNCAETVPNSSRNCQSTGCCFWWTVSKRNTHFEQSFHIDKYSNRKYTTFWYLQGVSYFTQFEFSISPFFLMVSGKTTRTCCVFVVCTTTFKFNKTHLHGLFRGSRVRIK